MIYTIESVNWGRVWDKQQDWGDYMFVYRPSIIVRMCFLNVNLIHLIQSVCLSVLLAPCELQCLSSHRASVSCSSLCFLLALSDDDDGGERQPEPGTTGSRAGRQQQAAMLNLTQDEERGWGQAGTRHFGQHSPQPPAWVREWSQEPELWLSDGWVSIWGH